MTLDERNAKRVMASQRGVLSRAQALSWGLTAHELAHRIRPDGPWQRVLPAVYLTVTGEPTREQLEVAALLYAGAGSVITGPAALRQYLTQAPETRLVDVLVPVDRKRSSREFAVLHRTRRMPELALTDGAIAFALPARAVADTVRGLARLGDVRAVVAAAVQERRCTIAELREELTRGPSNGRTPRLRTVLDEVAGGIRSAPEGDFLDLIRRSGLPMPMFNPRLYLNGKFLAQPDAWWPESGVIAEVDSRQWHSSPEHWEETMRRHARLGAVGIVVLHFSPRQIRTEPDRVQRVLAGALAVGRPLPGIVTRQAA